MASLAFATLFPDEKGDLTSNETIRQVSNKNNEFFAQKLQNLIKFEKYKNSNRVYRFANHIRLAIEHIMSFQKRLLGQGTFYLKLNFGKNIPTIDDLPAML